MNRPRRRRDLHEPAAIHDADAVGERHRFALVVRDNDEGEAEPAGLVAAIPAVIIYNVLARSTAQYRALLGDASAQVMKLVSRDLDRAQLPLSQAAE